MPIDQPGISATDPPVTDWFTANAPKTNTGVNGGSTDTTTTPAGGFTPDPGKGTPVPAGSPGFTAGQPVPSVYATGTANFGQAPTGGNLTDPSYAANLVNYYASQPGANPSLKNDPNYWIGKITSGELGTDQNYIIGKFMTPEGAPAGGMDPSGSGFPTAPQYTAPTYTGAPPPTAPTLATYSPTMYTAPTEAQLEASPGYAARLAAGAQVQQRGAAAQGTVLNGGSQQALARYGQDYASNEYNNLVGQTQAGVNLNNNATATATATNNNAAQTGFGDAFSNYQARYGQFTDAATMAKGAFDTNVSNNRNAATDYWSRLNDLYNTGANVASNSYKSGASA